MELHGGEMSYGRNREITLSIIDAAERERFQLQTNGLGDANFYSDLIKRSKKIDRIGFTYHRAVMGRDEAKIDTFTDNVINVNAAGLKVYVKELLSLDRKSEILEHEMYWTKFRGVEFRLQDFKDAGWVEKYTDEDWELIHPEYRHRGIFCQCRAGYKQILIRGYDQWAGDVLACWQDHKVIGSIVEDWYEPCQGVLKDTSAERGRTVLGNGKYRSDFGRDMILNRLEKKWHTINPKESKMLARLEADRERLIAIIRGAEARIAQRDKAIGQAQAENAQDRNLIALAHGGVQVTADHINWAKESSAKAAENPHGLVLSAPMGTAEHEPPTAVEPAFGEG